MASSSNSSSGNSSVNPISLAAGAASTIASTVSSIIDQTKRRQVETALNYLTSQQRNELEKQMAAARSENDRLEILSKSLVQYAIANETSGAKNNVWMYGIAAVLAISFLIVTVKYLKN